MPVLPFAVQAQRIAAHERAQRIAAFRGALGDATGLDPADLAFTAGTSMDPNVKAQLMAYAPQMPDDRAADLLDVVDATHYGGRAKLIRFGIGAAIGAVVGLLVARRKR